MTPPGRWRPRASDDSDDDARERDRCLLAVPGRDELPRVDRPAARDAPAAGMRAGIQYVEDLERCAAHVDHGPVLDVLDGRQRPVHGTTGFARGSRAPGLVRLD